jgi:sulfur carrier protein
VVTLDINGERLEFVSNPRVADLLARLALEGRKVAVERNGEIVPRSRFPDTWLADGDRLEIVVAVGGG